MITQLLKKKSKKKRCKIEPAVPLDDHTMAKSSKQRYRSQLAEPLNDHTIAKNFPKRCKSQLAPPRMIRQLLKIIKKRCKSQLVEPLNDHIAKNSTSQPVAPLNDHTITIKKRHHLLSIHCVGNLGDGKDQGGEMANLFIGHYWMTNNESKAIGGKK